MSKEQNTKGSKRMSKQEEIKELKEAKDTTEKLYRIFSNRKYRGDESQEWDHDMLSIFRALDTIKRRIEKLEGN